MDPYTQHLPHLREHNPSPYHYYPNWERTPLHMQPDSIKHPSTFDPWPYSGRVEHNCCCNHSYSPGYYSIRPPYFHWQHPPQMHYHGPYPPCPDSFPPYFIPPSHYAVDHDRFDYEKDRNHCCGCPNHVCHKLEGSSFRIEEEKATPKIDDEPEKVSKDGHSSLIRFPGSHFPIRWLPCNATRDGNTENNSQALPVLNTSDNLNDLQPVLGKSTFQGDGKFPPSPYPVYWLPGSEKPEVPVKEKKKIDATPKSAEEWSSRFRRPFLKLLDNENPDAKSKVAEEEPKIQNSTDSVTEKEKKIRTIPVVHFESRNMAENSVTGEKCDLSVKKDSSKKQPSHPKTSKLPPICLRVEPIPKKKGSNGKAQLQSPPGFKERGKINKDGNDQVDVVKNVADSTPHKVNEVFDVKEKPSGEEGNDTATAIGFGQDNEGIVQKYDHKDRKDAITDIDFQVEVDMGGNKEAANGFSVSRQPKIEQDKERVDSSDNTINNNKKLNNLSPEDAALRIQSAYRGFNVRRWQPLEKFRKLENIRRKVTAVKNQIQNFDVSSELNMKQKVVISETIMDLLLQLDAIQSLLPSLREVRKSVARELVFLQDKLDQICSQAMNEHQEGTEKEDECSSHLEKTISSASENQMKESNLVEQPSLRPKENDFVQEIGASSMSFDIKPAVFDKTACDLGIDGVKGPVDEAVIPSGTKYDRASHDDFVQGIGASSISFDIKPAVFDKSACDLGIDGVKGPVDEAVIPSGTKYDRASHDENENDRQADNLLSVAGEASVLEKSVSEDFVSHSHEGQAANIILKPQHEEDQDSVCKKLLSGANYSKTPQDEDEKDRQTDNLLSIAGEASTVEKSVSKEELLINEVNFDTEPDPGEVLAVKPDVGNRQSLFEGIILKENLYSSWDRSIKPEDAIGERSGEAIMEESNTVLDLPYEVGRSENCQFEPGLSTAMNLNQAGVVEDAETQRLSHGDSIEGELCLESVAECRNWSEMTPDIPANDQGTVDPPEFPTVSLIMDNKSSVESKCSTICVNSLKENNDKLVVSATNSIDEMESSENFANSTPEAHTWTENGKSVATGLGNEDGNINERKIAGQNAELRQMLESVLRAGQIQMGVISDLNNRMKNLEKRLSRRKKVKVNHNKASKQSVLSCE